MKNNSLELSLLQKASFVSRALAVEMGEELLELWHTARVTKKKDIGDFATQFDEITENNIVTALTKSFPDFGFVLEEEKNVREQAEFRWVIDPIDGTKYFKNMIPLFSVSIGLFKRELPVLGTIYNPVSQQLYWSYSGLGVVYRDIHELIGDEITENRLPILAMDLSKSNELVNQSVLEWTKKKYFDFLERFYRVRMIGNGSLSLAWMCEGSFDVLIDLTGKTKLVDVAAGLALLKESGGTFEFVKCNDGIKRLVAARKQTFLEEARKLLLT